MTRVVACRENLPEERIRSGSLAALFSTRCYPNETEDIPGRREMKSARNHSLGGRFTRRAWSLVDSVHLRSHRHPFEEGTSLRQPVRNPRHDATEVDRHPEDD